MNQLPYASLFYELLTQVHKALAYCCEQDAKERVVTARDEFLTRCFVQFEPRYRSAGTNKHITKGLTFSAQTRSDTYPRLSKLVVKAFYDAQEIRKSSGNFKGYVLPSPLGIVYHALTVPSEPQTASYAFVLCRSMLFSLLNVHPVHPHLQSINPDIVPISEEDILGSISSLRNHIKIQARWPGPSYDRDSNKARRHFLLGHILSLKGATYLWFKDRRDPLLFCRAALKSQQGWTNAYCHPKLYSFRLSGIYEELPEAAEIINWVFGVPIPIRGADVLFYGGLKRTHSAGLVVSIQGQPGVGKTTVALSLSAALAPLGTETVYLSLEEPAQDLTSRLYTLIPPYLRELEIHPHTDALNVNSNHQQIDWFHPYEVNPRIKATDFTDFLKLLRSDLKAPSRTAKGQNRQAQENRAKHSLPAVAPLLVVIDNINQLFAADQQYDQVEGFLEQCRKLGAIVLLLAAEGLPTKLNLDYLVDVSIKLCHVGINDPNEKPVRLLQLMKTRHQISRPGAHVFHISSGGLKISPQVPSQLDKREKIRPLLPSETRHILALNYHRTKGKLVYEDFLPIKARSQILIHGYGSSGKAGLGLRLLMSPEFRDLGQKQKNSQKAGLSECRVLVISFLYPSDYYVKLERIIQRELKETYAGFGQVPDAHVRTIAFYPGYLTPEDFVSRITRALDEASLEGEPYTGVMLDGLHNVFLQFKNLQSAHMIWPLLYNILSRYNLTVVTTFTNFSLTDGVSPTVDGGGNTGSIEDAALMQQGQKPFLHGLVKAADYYFMLREVSDKNHGFKKKYWLTVKASPEDPPERGVVWNRQRATFEGFVEAAELNS